MSKVKIEGNPSGTGTLTIAAPNTNTDRTLTLPDGAGELVTNSYSGSVTISPTTGENFVITRDSGGVYIGNSHNGNLRLINNDTERMRLDTSGNLLFNSGYGSVATAYGCRAWVNFNGTGTLSIRGSANVSSVSDTGTGQYDVNFSTSMPDANYCATTGLSQHNPPDDYDMRFHVFARTLTTGYCRLLCAQVQNGLSVTDSAQALVAIFR